MARLFAALRPPAEKRDALAKLQAGLPDARWLDPEDFHVTLGFFGDLREPVADELAFELSRVRSEPVALALAGVGVFPPRGQPTALWAGVGADPGLAALKRAVDRAAKASGVALEKRAYKPHVTLARFRSPPPLGRLQSYLSRRSLFRTEPVTLSAFDLIASHLRPEGAHYQTEARFDFVLGRAAAADEDLENEWELWS